MENLPQLEGTEKQVSRADQIREKVVSEAISYYESKHYCAWEEPKDADQIVRIFSKYKKASWWIDRRDEFKHKHGWDCYI